MILTQATPKILYYGLASCYWLMTRKYGLGHHSARVGGPVDEQTEVGFFKVCSKPGRSVDSVRTLLSNRI